MIRVRNGYIEVPLPNLDFAIQTVRAGVYGREEKTKAEMLFRKSALYDILKVKRSLHSVSHDDSLLLLNIWKSNPEYLDYCVAINDDIGSALTLFPTQQTLDDASDFAQLMFPERYSTFANNANIVGAMIDAMGVPVAKAAYFGASIEKIYGVDILNTCVLGLSAKEILYCRANDMGVSFPRDIKESYFAIYKATQSIESILFAASRIDVKLSIEMINHNMSFGALMRVM